MIITKSERQSKLSACFVGAFIMLVLMILFILVCFKITAKNEFQGNKTTINSPLTNVKINQISTGKACNITNGCIVDAALFIGAINSNSAALFVNYLDKNPDLKTVCFGSGGGELNAAKVISSYVIKHKLTTCMADYYQFSEYNNEIIRIASCSSACNQILLSSKKRLQIGSLIYFNGHGYAKDSLNKINFFDRKWEILSTSLIENSMFVDTIKTANTKDKEQHLAYAKLVANIDHFNDMKTLTHAELIRYRIFTHRCKKQCVLI